MHTNPKKPKGEVSVNNLAATNARNYSYLMTPKKAVKGLS
jgi:hypothetical protein